jgi:hypothetical protein
MVICLHIIRRGSVQLGEHTQLRRKDLGNLSPLTAPFFPRADSLPLEDVPFPDHAVTASNLVSCCPSGEFYAISY